MAAREKVGAGTVILVLFTGALLAYAATSFTTVVSNTTVPSPSGLAGSLGVTDALNNTLAYEAVSYIYSLLVYLVEVLSKPQTVVTLIVAFLVYHTSSG